MAKLKSELRVRVDTYPGYNLALHKRRVPDMRELVYDDDHTFSISNIDGVNKYTLNCRRCLALILLGKKKKDEKQLSLLVHASPQAATNGKFLLELQEQIDVFKNRTAEIFRMAVVAGGCYPVVFRNSREYRHDEGWGRHAHESRMSEMLSDVRNQYVSAIRNINPILLAASYIPPIIIPPKFVPGETDVYCSTHKPSVNVRQNNPTIAKEYPRFVANDIPENIALWKRACLKTWRGEDHH